MKDHDGTNCRLVIKCGNLSNRKKNGKTKDTKVIEIKIETIAPMSLTA